MDELTVEAKIENMNTVLDFVTARLENCSPKIQHQIGIVVDEIFSNIVRYAYHPLFGDAVIRVTVDDVIIVEFEDSGKPYDPLAKDDPDISLSANEREVGGLGIFMVKNIMDSVEYRREDNKNIVTVMKKR